MTAPEDAADTRDAHLRAALRQAPDADLAASDTLRRRIFAAAHEEAARQTGGAPRGVRAGVSALAGAFEWLTRPRHASAFAGVLVAVIGGWMWWDRVPEWERPAPAAESPAAVSPAPSQPAEPAAAAPQAVGGAERRRDATAAREAESARAREGARARHDRPGAPAADGQAPTRLREAAPVTPSPSPAPSEPPRKSAADVDRGAAAGTTRSSPKGSPANLPDSPPRSTADPDATVARPAPPEPVAPRSEVPLPAPAALPAPAPATGAAAPAVTATPSVPGAAAVPPAPAAMSSAASPSVSVPFDAASAARVEERAAGQASPALLARAPSAVRSAAAASASALPRDLAALRDAVVAEPSGWTLRLTPPDGTLRTQPVTPPVIELLDALRALDAPAWTLAEDAAEPIAELRLQRTGEPPVVLRLHADALSWQQPGRRLRLPLAPEAVDALRRAFDGAAR